MSAMRDESYSFIWQPKVLIKTFLGIFGTVESDMVIALIAKRYFNAILASQIKVLVYKNQKRARSPFLIANTE